jgi:hypothetical protein
MLPSVPLPTLSPATVPAVPPSTSPADNAVAATAPPAAVVERVTNSAAKLVEAAAPTPESIPANPTASTDDVAPAALRGAPVEAQLVAADAPDRAARVPPSAADARGSGEIRTATESAEVEAAADETADPVFAATQLFPRLEPTPDASGDTQTAGVQTAFITSNRAAISVQIILPQRLVTAIVTIIPSTGGPSAAILGGGLIALGGVGVWLRRTGRATRRHTRRS